MLHTASLAVVLQLSNLAGAPSPVVAAAQTEVTRVYSAAGVAVRWQATRPSDTNAILVVLLPVETGGLRRITDTVMGAAVHTNRGTRVAYVFYERVKQQAKRHRMSSALVLACAMSHELGHLLLDSRAHSPAGLMRASWRRAEFYQAVRGQLRFSTEEGAYIRTRTLEPEPLAEDSEREGGLVPTPMNPGSADCVFT